MTSSSVTCQQTSVQIKEHEVPALTFLLADEVPRAELANLIIQTVGQSLLVNLLTSCRGVGIERLPTILANGCDVEPSNSPLYVSSLEKAPEYGQSEVQEIQVFHHQSLKRSWQEHQDTLSRQKYLEVINDYPTVINNNDDNSLRFTRLSPDDNRAGTDNERAYGHWIFSRVQIWLFQPCF